MQIQILACNFALNSGEAHSASPRSSPTECCSRSRAPSQRRFRNGRADYGSEGDDKLTIRRIYTVSSEVSLDAFIEFDGSSSSHIKRVSFGPAPTNFNATEAKTAAAWKFLAARLGLGAMASKSTLGA